MYKLYKGAKAKMIKSGINNILGKSCAIFRSPEIIFINRVAEITPIKRISHRFASQLEF